MMWEFIHYQIQEIFSKKKKKKNQKISKNYNRNNTKKSLEK